MKRTGDLPKDAVALNKVHRGLPVHTSAHVLQSSGRARPAPAAKPAETSGGLHDAFEAGREQGLARGREEAAAQERSRFDALLEEAGRTAHQLGREQGTQQGLREGRELAAREASDLKERLQAQFESATQELRAQVARLAESFAQAHAQWRDQCEDDVVAIAFEAVCRILGEQAVRPEVLRAVVHQLLTKHGLHGALQVHVHPADFEWIGREGDASSGASSWQWRPDETVAAGGVMLCSPQANLDARLETQLAALAGALLETRRQRRLGDASGETGTPS